MAKMFPLLFPYGEAKVSTQAAQHLPYEQCSNLLYLHSTGAWDATAAETKATNLANIKNKRGIVLSRHHYDESTFIIKTRFNLAEEDYQTFLEPHPQFKEVNYLGWSDWPRRIVTVISLATLHELTGSGINI